MAAEVAMLPGDLSLDREYLYRSWNPDELNESIGRFGDSVSTNADPHVVLTQLNQQRCQLMQHCHQQMQFWRTKLDKLRQAHKKQRRYFLLKQDAASVWPTWPRRERWDKAVVLYAVRHSPTLPTQFESPFWETQAPEALQQDMEIVRAFLERPMGQGYGPVLSNLSPKLLANVSLMQLAVPIWPEAVLRQLSTTSHWHENCVTYFQALLTTSHPDTTYYHDYFARLDPIRDSPELMLELWKSWSVSTQDMGVRWHGSSLKNNVNFALQVAELAKSIPPNALRSFSPQLRDDTQVVKAFLVRNGDNLRHASARLRKHFTCVQQAALDQPTALQHALPSRCKAQLTQNLAFLTQLFQKLNESPAPTTSYTTLWKLLMSNKATAQLIQKHDRTAWNLCLAAVRVGHQHLPPRLAHNKAFWHQAIDQGPHFSFSQLPPGLWKSDPQVGLHFVCQSALSLQWFDPNAVRQVFSRHPQLLSEDPRCIVPLVMYHKTTHRDTDTDDFLLHHWPLLDQAFWHNKATLLECLPLAPRATLQCVPTTLWSDFEIVNAALQHYGAPALEFIPDEVQVENVELISNVIRMGTNLDDPENNNTADSLSTSSSVSSAGIWSLFPWIAPELWRHPCLCHAWVSRGGDFLHDEFDPSLEHDRTLFLEIAKRNWCDFMFASALLLSDKEFLKQAVRCNAFCLREGRDDLDEDFDLALIAFGNNDEQNVTDALEHYEWSSVGSADFRFLTRFAQHVRQQLEACESFQLFVLGVALAPELPIEEQREHGLREHSSFPHVKNNVLGRLQFGQETTHAIQSAIANYVGVPSGEELRFLRNASRNLAHYGF